MNMDEVKLYRDGDKWCAVYEPTFTNIQESPVGFGDTQIEALAALVKDQLKHLQKEETGVMNTDSSELDDILGDLAQECQLYGQRPEDFGSHPSITEYKAQILSRYRSVASIKEAVGNQDYITKHSGNSRVDQETQSKIDGANNLRKEILATLKIGDSTHETK